MKGVELIISDDHSGLKAARKAVFPSVPWQRCQFHLAQNAQSYIPRISLRKPLGGVLKSIFNAPTKADAMVLKTRALKQYEKIAPEWCQ